MLNRLKRLLKPSAAIDTAVMFYATSSVDEVWVRSTALALAQTGTPCALVISNGSLSDDIKAQYDAAQIPVMVNAGRVAQCRADIVITASSGLPADWFAPSVRWRVHMPHSIASLHMIYSADCFDGYNVLFAVGPHHRAEFETLSHQRNLPDRLIYNIGYGKLDVMHSRPKENTQPHILVAPSWGQQNILNAVETELFTALLDNGYRVTLRPHPLFFIENDPFLKTIQQTVNQHPDFTIESSLSTGNALFEADLLVTDYSGTAQEFAALQAKPVVFVDVPKKILNPEWQSLKLEPIELRSRNVLGPLAQPNTESIIGAIDDALNNTAQWAAKIKAFEPNFLYSRDCAKTAVAAIHSLLQQPKEMAA